MYIVEITIPVGNTSPADTELAVGTSYIPAERCHWQQVQAPDGSNYIITNVHFISGNGTQTALSGTGTGGANVLRLGYIGKTGRFVGMTV